MLKLILIVAVLVEISLVPVPSHATAGEKYNSDESDTMAVVSYAGKKNKMEDEFATLERIKNYLHTMKPVTSLYGVFDGHNGGYAAQYTRDYLLENLKSKIKDAGKHYNDYGTLLRTGVENFEKQLNKELLRKKDNSGTCAIIALIRGSDLYVANVGDSRAVIGTENGGTITITKDHKPTDGGEMERVAHAGGFIAGNAIYSTVDGGLRVTRSLGDRVLKSNTPGLIADPDVSHTNLKAVDSKFIILASDGLWDVFSSEQAVQIINNNFDKTMFGAEQLVLEAIKNDAHDDITVMVIKTN